VAITLVGAWSLQGSTANYGYSPSLASSAVNVPAGALIVTGCSVAHGYVPNVSDTAGNTYTVLPLFSGTATGTQDVYVAYCLSAKGNTTNVVTWSASGSAVQANNGAVYSTSSGNWSYDTNVSGEQGVGYGTNLNLSITTSGAGLIAGLFFEYYAQAQQPWALTGLTQQAVTQDTSTGTGAPGNVYGDAITTAAQTAYAISATDGSAGLAGGKVTGFAVAFKVASSAGSNALAGSGVQSAAASGQLSVAVALHSASLQTQGAQGALDVQVPLSGYATATQQADGSLSISVPLSASGVQTALARASLGVRVPLAGAGTQQAAAVAQMSVHVALAGEQLQQAVAAAILTNTAAGAVALAGSSAQAQAAQGTLSVAQALQGASLAISAGSGALAVAVPLSASSVQASRATGSLSVGITLRGDGLQDALAKATLSNIGTIDLSGAGRQQQGAQAVLTLQLHLTAESVQQVSAVAALGNSTITTYVANGRYYAAAPIRSFYAASPQRSTYAAAPLRSFYATP
jgi:hypothetical protein